MGLLAEFGGAADDAVATVGDVGNKPRAVVEKLKLNTVAHGNRVGLLAAADAEITPQAASEGLATVGQHIIPTTCSPDN